MLQFVSTTTYTLRFASGRTITRSRIDDIYSALPDRCTLEIGRAHV